MEVSKIIYYTRENGNSRTVSLKELNLREYCFLEDVFYAVRDAVDMEDLLSRFRRIICDPVELDTTDPKNPRFVITDATGNTNYIRLKPAKKENQ